MLARRVSASSSCLGNYQVKTKSRNHFYPSLQINNALQIAAVDKVRAERDAGMARTSASATRLAMKAQRQVQDQQAASIDKLEDRLMTVSASVMRVRCCTSASADAPIHIAAEDSENGACLPWGVDRDQSCTCILISSSNRLTATTGTNDSVFFALAGGAEVLDRSERQGKPCYARCEHIQHVQQTCNNCV